MVLPVVQDAGPAADGACCAACAAAPAARPARLAGDRPVLDRDADRRITAAGLAVAIGFLVAAAAALVAGPGRPSALWLPVHLALAGGAGTAIAAVLPFFAAALSVAAPVRPAIRILGIAGVAAGAALVSVTVAVGDAFLAHVGGTIYLAGVAGVAAAVWLPTRRALGPRRPLVLGASLIALGTLALSATLAIVFLAGWEPVVERWASLKPAHAWLNLFGFLSLVIATTLLHLGPTVEGARIRERRSGRIALTGIAAGSAAVALGFAFGSDLLARVGAVAALAGAIAVPIHASVVARDSAPWSTDRDWHRMTTWSLRAAATWFALAMAVAAGRVVVLGATPAAWSLDAIAVPFALGWAIQALIGSWSHLLPAVVAGNAERRRTARRWLGWAAAPRLVMLQGGIAALWLGAATQTVPVAIVGGLGAGGALALAVASTVAAVGDPRRGHETTAAGTTAPSSI